MSATLSHFVNDAWAKVAPYRVNPHSSHMSGPSERMRYAPDAYRVAMPTVLQTLISPPIALSPHYAFAALDFVFAAVTLILLARFAVLGVAVTEDNRTRRMLVTALFLAFAQFPLAWVVPWQRPETMASALFLAVALWCIAKGTEGIVWTGLLLVVAVLQSLTRTDVPFVFGCGLVLAGLLSSSAQPAEKRIVVTRGLAVAAIAAATEAYLQFIRFPGLHYPPGVPLFTYRFNLVPHNFGNGILGVLPLLVGVGPAIYVWRKLPILHRAILISSLLYLVLWTTVAILDEVRVYVPFLLILCVVAANAWGGNDNDGYLASIGTGQESKISVGD